MYRLIWDLREDVDLLKSNSKPTDMIEVKIAMDIRKAIEKIEELQKGIKKIEKLKDDIISMRGCE